MRLLCSALAAALLAACAKGGPVAAPAADAPRPLLLWEVSRDGNTSHVMGTCHLPIPLEYALPEAHRARLLGSRVLYTELDLSRIDFSAVLDSIWRTGDDRLDARLSPEAWQRVYHDYDAYPATSLRHLPAWVVSSLDTFGGALRQGQAPPEPGEVPILDVAVQGAATEAGVAHAYLETMEAQIGFVEKVEPESLALLEGDEALRADERRLVQSIREACRTGDADGIAGVVSDIGDMDAIDVLLHERNAAWMPTIEAAFAEGGAFVAVGAAHVVGDRGLLELLEERGFTVTPLAGPPAPAPELPEPQAKRTLGEPVPEYVSAVDRVAAGAGALADVFCAAPEVACFVSADTCKERLTADAALCIDQVRPFAEANGVDEATSTWIAQCTLSDVMVTSLLPGWETDDPACREIADALRAAMDGLF